MKKAFCLAGAFLCVAAFFPPMAQASGREIDLYQYRSNQRLVRFIQQAEGRAAGIAPLPGGCDILKLEVSRNIREFPCKSRLSNLDNHATGKGCD